MPTENNVSQTTDTQPASSLSKIEDKTDLTERGNYPPENKYPELTTKPQDKTAIIVAVIVAILALIGFVGLTYLLYSYPVVTQILRDIVIIYLGFAVVLIMVILVVLTAVLLYLALKVNDLVQLLNREIKPILVNMQSTIAELRGTTSFISNKAVQPVIETVSIMTATRKVLKSIFWE
ncbi:hypothetical protein QUF58_01905 [Anaerolineales bacterium HSG24]|nr:hypothetical protein [Anaerolineales bacterium HSG24]